MTRIVTSTYRYKPPPRRKGRKLAEITGPAIVTTKKGRRQGETAAEVGVGPPGVGPADSPQPTTAQAASGDHIPANDDRKSAIVTARKPRSWRSDVPDMTPGEHKRRGDAADALFREMKRRIGKV